MDRITQADLQTFLNDHEGWCVSLYLPTHRRGRETEQDPIRFRNLLQEAEARLLGKGLRTPDVKAMLQPARDLLIDPAFWRRMSDGLAVFVSQAELHAYRLPLPFDELVVVTHRFHIKPLLPFFTNDGHFYILALSQNAVRLLEGTRHTVDELDLESIPTSLSEALQYEQYEKQLQVRGGKRAGNGLQTGMYHGHDPADEEKNRLLRWFHKLDDELRVLLENERSPLVLAGVEYLHPLYAQANRYPHLLEAGIPGNPEELKPAELHRRAWRLVEPVFRQAQEAARARYQELSSQGLTTSALKDALLAAQAGRVESVFVPLGMQIWGRYDPGSQTLHVHPQAAPGDEDLLDQLAILTLQAGGEVYAVPPAEIPGGENLAAIYRY